jgi:Tol biopolymer transport system component
MKMRSFLEIYELASGQVTQVLVSEKVMEAPNWSPCGTYLLINCEGRLFKVPLAVPEMLAVDTGAAVRCNNDHGISPDGARIVISSHHEGEGSRIYHVPAAGGAPVRVTTLAPSWWHGISPDGKALAYVAARGGSRVIDVYTSGWDGSERRLTMGEGHCDGPDYSADGAQIYYNCDRDGHAQIWVMNADGAGQRKLFADEYVNWFPHPAPDGQHLLYLAYPPGTTGHPGDLPVALVLCDPNGGNQRRILEFNGGQGSINVPCWSPDGAKFAYMRFAKGDSGRDRGDGSA